MFARIRDELNAISKSKKENRIILTGLTHFFSLPSGVDEKKRYEIGEFICLYSGKFFVLVYLDR